MTSPSDSFNLELEQLRLIFEKSWSKSTTHWPHKWSKESPSVGQCVPTSLIIQDIYKGSLVSSKIGNVRHYWNVVSDGTEVDLTRDQFLVFKITPPVVIKNRLDLLQNRDVYDRYFHLKEMVKMNCPDGWVFGGIPLEWL